MTLPVIATARLRLRPRTPDDAEALFSALSDPAVMTWWSRPPYATIEELRANFVPKPELGWRCWAVTAQGDDRALGFVSAFAKREGVSEIGYMLAPGAQGRGLAGEAIAGLIGLLFTEGHRRLFADVDPDNLRSIALLERLGFALEGRLRAEWQTHIGVRDSLIYGLLAGEWRG
jgi:[ribosomal protein S5]-alanine N-acetyltransferase